MGKPDQFGNGYPMMTFDEVTVDYSDIFELLEAVRQYELRPKESIILLNSVKGSVLGYVTAHPEYPSIEWAIPTKSALNSARARGTREGVRIRELLGNSLGRKQILKELRDGSLEYGIMRMPEPVGPPKPKQMTIPGL